MVFPVLGPGFRSKLWAGLGVQLGVLILARLVDEVLSVNLIRHKPRKRAQFQPQLEGGTVEPNVLNTLTRSPDST